MNSELATSSLPKTGNCFYVHLHELARNPQYTLVHGVCIGQGEIEGIEHCHCWLEYTVSLDECDFQMVYDCSNGNNVHLPATLYYKLGKINEKLCARYSKDAALSMTLKTNNYGPWHKLPEHVI